MEYIGYGVVFVVIGFFTGLVAKRFMPIGVSAGPLTLALVGIVGAVAAGLGALALLIEGHRHAFAYGWHYADVPSTQTSTTMPGLWTTPLVALAGALVLLAIFKLVTGREEHTI